MEDDLNENNNSILLSTFVSPRQEDEGSLFDVPASSSSHDKLPHKDEDIPPPSMTMFLLVAWVTFLGEMSRGVVVPVLWDYLQAVNGTEYFLGFVTSGFSFARFFAAPFFGWWSGKRSHKEAMLICLVLLVIGNTIFALYPPPWVILLSRIIIGVGAGTLGQSRGYVSQVTTKSQRTRYMAYLTVSQFVGFAVTPGLNIALSHVDFDMFGNEKLEADKYSSSGYLLAVLSTCTSALVALVFVDPPKQTITIKVAKPKRGFTSFVKDTIESMSARLDHPARNTILLFSALIFITRTAVAIVETANSPLSKTFGWSTQTLSFFLCGMGVLGTLILIAVPVICRRLGRSGEGILLCVGVFSLSFGMALMIHRSEVSFVLGLGLTWALGSALCQTLILTFLSHLLSPDSQGTVMGGLASLGSVARIVGGLWFGLGFSTYVTLGVPSFLMLPCLAGTAFLVVRSVRSLSNAKL